MYNVKLKNSITFDFYITSNETYFQTKASSVREIYEYSETTKNTSRACFDCALIYSRNTIVTNLQNSYLKISYFRREVAISGENYQKRSSNTGLAVVGIDVS